MKSPARILSVLLAVCAWPSVWAMAGSLLQVGGATRGEVRRAVEAHRASQREEVRREEATAGRRLTPAELAELRSQVRQQWSPRYDAAQPGLPIMPAMSSDEDAAPILDTRSLTMPRSQRP
jgi:hypothetical protein